MEETRSERFSVSLTPSMLKRLDALRAQYHWTRSTAAAVLIEKGLDKEDQEQGKRG